MKKLNLQYHWRKLLLIAVCVAAALFIGYVYGKNAVETELRELANNLYGGKYYVDVAYAGPGGQTNTVTLSASGFRLPMHDSEGDSYVKEAIPFIERHDVPYDISHFALVDGNSDGGFEFTFMGCPTPDNVFVQRWPRDYQGTIGTFTNGEIVDLETSAQPMKYHTSNFEPGYIYSIYASWGPYYGEYAFLVSTQESDQVYWKLEANIESGEDDSTGGIQTVVEPDQFIKEIADQWLVDGDYPKNEKGETYGPEILFDVVGYMPDLITATATNGQDGYLRSSEMDALLSSTDHQSYSLPVYDLNGNVIGEFVFEDGPA